MSQFTETADAVEATLTELGVPFLIVDDEPSSLERVRIWRLAPVNGEEVHPAFSLFADGSSIGVPEVSIGATMRTDDGDVLTHLPSMLLVAPRPALTRRFVAAYLAGIEGGEWL